MNWVTVAIIVIVCCSALIGLARGLVVEIGLLVGGALAVYLASRYYIQVANFLGLFFHHDAHLGLIAFLLVAVAIWTAVAVATRMIRTALRLTPLGLLDRLGGLAIGLLYGLIVVEILLVVSLRSHDQALVHTISRSNLAQVVRHNSLGLYHLVPRHIDVPSSGPLVGQ